MLAAELRKLEVAGIVARPEFPRYPLRVEYDLTPAGLALVPLIEALADWWDGHEPDRTTTRAALAGAAGRD